MRRSAVLPLLGLLAGSLLLAPQGAYSQTPTVAPGPGEKCIKGGYPGPIPEYNPKPCKTVNRTAYECHCPVPADPMIPDASCTGTCVVQQCSPCPKATVQCIRSCGECGKGFACNCGGRNDCCGVCKAPPPKPSPPKPSPPPPRPVYPGPGQKCQILGLAEKFPPPPACKSSGGYEYTCKCDPAHDPNFRCNGTCVKRECSPCPNATVLCFRSCGECSKGFACDCGGKNECCGYCKKPVPPPPDLTIPVGLGEQCGACPNATVQCLIGYPGCKKGLFCDCGGRNACSGRCAKLPPPPPPSGQPLGAKCSPCPKSTVQCLIGYGACAKGLKCDCGGKTDVCNGICVKPPPPPPPPGQALGEKCSPCPNSTLACLIGYGKCAKGLVCDCGGKDACNGYCVKPPAGPLPGQKCTRPGFIFGPLPPACASPVEGYSYYCKCPPMDPPIIADLPCTGVCTKQKCSPCPNSTLQCLIGYGACATGYACDCGGKDACSGYCKTASLLPCCPPVIRVDQPPCRDCGLRGL